MDNTKKNNPYTHEPKKRVSWRAIFAGGFVATPVGISLADTSGVVQGIMTRDLYPLISAWLLTTVVAPIILVVGNAVGDVISITGEAAGNAFAPVIVKQVEELDISLKGAKNRAPGIKKCFKINYKGEENV